MTATPEEIQVASWDELLVTLFADSWRPDIQRFRSPFAFRGQSDRAMTLATSLERLGGPYAQMERHLLRNFRKYADFRDVEKDSLWNWLALAKHHGLPTRVLDWTYSPLVALHFATAHLRDFDRDGAVWMVNFGEVQRRLPQSLRRCLEQEGSDVFTVDMLNQTARTLEDFERLAAETFVVFFEPPALDARIVNQHALFSLSSDPHHRLDDGRMPLRKIVFPAALKWEIRDKLDQANITERVLFPGLDGLSAWLKRQYTPRPAADPAADRP